MSNFVCVVLGHLWTSQTIHPEPGQMEVRLICRRCGERKYQPKHA